MPMKIKNFYLLRKKDIHGVSGCGIVAVGSIMPKTGHAILEWQSETPSVNFYENIRHLKKVHGHGGLTQVIMGDVPEKEKCNVKKDRKPKT
jgi:hypothetical protein